MDDSRITWGFDKQTAQHLQARVGGVDSESPDGVGRMTPCLYAKTKSGGIVVGTPALVEIYDKDDVLRDRELLAEARGNDIPGDTEIVIISAYSRWLALELRGGLRTISGVATAWGTQSGGDFAGLKYADITIIEASDQALLGTSVRVYDRKGCILDINVVDYTVCAHELWASSMDTSKPCPAAVQYWSADDRCCDADTAIYRPCGGV